MPDPSLPNEKKAVEQPLIVQLKSMGWNHIEGDVSVPYADGLRTSFREVLLTERLRKALRKINPDAAGRPWLDDTRLELAINKLQQVGGGGMPLTEINHMVSEQLLAGAAAPGDPQQHGNKDQTIRYFDFEQPENNDFLAVSQFRVNVPGGSYIVPDVVLFVNGIPLVVIECKSPAATRPLEAAIEQLLRYASSHGNERLFYYNLLMVASDLHHTSFGTVGATAEAYHEWRDPAPLTKEELKQQLGRQTLYGQHLLVAGMLHPANLLDLFGNFTVFQESGGRTRKIVARYHQFRAVQTTVNRLLTGATRSQHGERDRRGGVIWHTQGSGKSLTMVFLVRKMRRLARLRGFKIVVVTDRDSLEKQLRQTAALSGEQPRTVRSSEHLREVLSEKGADFVFAMIQKYQLDEDEREQAQEGDVQFPLLNESENILVLVDEAHRSHANKLHAHLMAALPNCARVGFTGTPIVAAGKKATIQIFGDYLDRYTIADSERDGTTVPIHYAGRTARAEVSRSSELDQAFTDMFRRRSDKQRARLRDKYATEQSVLESEQMIEAKANDMLRHYVASILPNGFKAQVVATSRLAAHRYQQALFNAQRRLVATLETLEPALLQLSDDELNQRDTETQFLMRAYPYLGTIRRLEFAAVISQGKISEPGMERWSEQRLIDEHIERFKKPLLNNADPQEQDGLAFLCVKKMLLTGFDAPVEQVLYLDQIIKEHELLQAIARVNRPYPNKTHGLVVDYVGVTQHLKTALQAYDAEDVQGVMTDIRDMRHRLEDQRATVIELFTQNGVSDVEDVDACVTLLENQKLRAEFIVRLRRFLATVDEVLPGVYALPYLHDARLFGLINKYANNYYRDPQLKLVGVGQKVRQLINSHLRVLGIDPQVEPIPVTEASFKAAVESLPSDRAKASTMSHALRYHINAHLDEDPPYYQKLSERLEVVLSSLQGRWSELAAALTQLSDEVRQGPPAHDSGLDPRAEVPVLSLLLQTTGIRIQPPDPRGARLISLAREIVAILKKETRRVDFWINKYDQQRLRNLLLTDYLDDETADISINQQEHLADEIMSLAYKLYDRLTQP